MAEGKKFKQSLSELKEEREKLLKQMEKLKEKYVEITRALIKKQKGGDK
ncbi:hypothetical protein KAX02_05370 [candidate division WOR-3 bacterium]|nr:hypothetical protein [candidate division WOR-3 bacterium]